MRSKVHLVTASDENFLTGVIAQLASATLNLSLGHGLHAHVLLHNVRPEIIENMRRALAPLAARGLDVSLIPLDASVFGDIRVRRADKTLSTYTRILIPRLLPDLDKVIYVDADTIIHDDLVPLWNMITPDKVMLAMAENKMRASMPNYLDFALDPDVYYFNAGVLGMNLRAMREGNYVEKCLELATDASRSFTWDDQCILNIVFHKKVDYIPRKWNRVTYLHENVVSFLPRRPCIIHTVCAQKPWLYERKGSHGVVKLFYHYVDQTDWDRVRSAAAPVVYRQKPSAARRALAMARFQLDRLRGALPADA